MTPEEIAAIYPLEVIEMAIQMIEEENKKKIIN